MKLSILWEAGTILWSYFRPTVENLYRFTGFVCSLIVVPAANIVVPKLFLKFYSNDNKDDNNFTSSFVPALTVAILYGAQQSLSISLAQSMTQALRKYNLNLLLNDKTKFLLKAKPGLPKLGEKFSSIQYVTVGKGIDDFSTNTIQLLVTTPTYIISTATTIVYIGLTADSVKTAGYVTILSSSSALAMYGFMRLYSSYNQSNQIVENNLVAKVGFLEANKTAITLMNATLIENDLLLKNIQKVSFTIPKLSFLALSYFTLQNLSPAVASHFLGGYYSDSSITKLSDTDKDFLNVMIMIMINNISQLVTCLTQNYKYIELNLKELKAFYNEYNRCIEVKVKYSKMIQQFDGDDFSLVNFYVNPPVDICGQSLSAFQGLQNINLTLQPQKFYRVLAPSGHGKTTFFKAITNNWDFTDGIVKFPKCALESIHFIPQEPFIPQGTLFDILTYAIIKPNFLTNAYLIALLRSIPIDTDIDHGKEGYERSLTRPLLDDNFFSINYEYSSINLTNHITGNRIYQQSNSIGPDNSVLKTMLKLLLTKVGLMPSTIREEELEDSGIDWITRLSGGEKQKLAIVRAILDSPRFIVMDEGTSALDSINKTLVHEMLKAYKSSIPGFIGMFTSHDDNDSLADADLIIIGNNLVYEHYI